MIKKMSKASQIIPVGYPVGTEKGSQEDKNIRSVNRHNRKMRARA
jgi:thiazole synthase ThiGH ThiG subunit|tara:strand:+ start:568 stop:702 length:135 start_codon:yes stop_codon:yes gene_type:complete